MQQFLSNGGLSKMLWIILMFIMALGCMVLLFIELVNNQPMNPFVMSLLSGIVMHGATVGGHILGKSAPEALHTGQHSVTVTPAPAPITIVPPAGGTITGGLADV